MNLAEFSGAKLVKVFAGQTELVCMASRVAGSLFHPKVVLMGNDAGYQSMSDNRYYVKSAVIQATETARSAAFVTPWLRRQFDVR